MLKKNNVNIKKKYIYILFVLFLLIVLNLIEKILIVKKEKNNNFGKNCYLSYDNSDLKIIHVILTRFLFFSFNRRKDYILNGIRVMKKYLLPSLENQSCKDFIWILILGDKANMTSLKPFLNFNNSFQWHLIYKKDLKKFVRNITKGFEIQITTRIDYDDRIYYDAVNDVRKEINIKRPIFLHGYNKGVYYFEYNNKYYDLEVSGKRGAFSVFVSLIIFLNKVNGTCTIFDFGHHHSVKANLLRNYKSYGIKKLDYEPAIFEYGASKFVYVRQKYSIFYKYSISQMSKQMLKINKNFNLSKFYGK